MCKDVGHYTNMTSSETNHSLLGHQVFDVRSEIHD